MLNSSRFIRPLCKHTHTNHLAKAPRRRNQHLGCQVLPAVELQHLLVVPRELACWLRLPERPCARLLFVYCDESDI